MKRGLSVEFVHFSGEPYLDPTGDDEGAGAGEGPERLPGRAARRRCGWCRSGTSSGCSRRSRRSRTGSCSTGARWPGSPARSPSGCGAAALVTGDSLGQVSSQTLPNMTSVEEASELPVLRPLLTWDKREVMAQGGRSSGSCRCRSCPPRTPARCSPAASSAPPCPRAALLEAEAQLDLGGAGGGGLPRSARRVARRSVPRRRSSLMRGSPKSADGQTADGRLADGRTATARRERSGGRTRRRGSNRFACRRAG